MFFLKPLKMKLLVLKYILNVAYLALLQGNPECIK